MSRFRKNKERIIKWFAGLVAVVLLGAGGSVMMAAPANAARLGDCPSAGTTSKRLMRTATPGRLVYKRYLYGTGESCWQACTEFRRRGTFDIRVSRSPDDRRRAVCVHGLPNTERYARKVEVWLWRVRIPDDYVVDTIPRRRYG